MAWPKIKNIIILILLGTNLCLLGFAVSRGIHSWQLQSQSRADAIAFLEEQGIRLNQEQIPVIMTLRRCYAARDLEQEAKVAAALLMGEVERQDRGAEVFRYYNDNGSVQFHSNGEFSAQFTPGVLPLEEEGAQAHGLQVLERLDFQGQLLKSVEEEGRQLVTFRQNWGESALLNCQAVLNYENGSLVSITSARRLMGTPEEDAEGDPISSATALMRFYNAMHATGDVFTQITGITQGYVLSATLSEFVTLVPVWRIETDIGTFQLDLMTGSASRIG